MPTINEIVRQFGREYLKRYGASMLPSHVAALKALTQCRTEEMGFHSQICLECGYEHRVFHSCKNRSCPQCFFQRTQEWLEVQQQRLLPVPYFHVVFTLPSQLREIVRAHQKALYPVLFRAAVESLQDLAQDERYVGGKLGLMAVLHTWSGAMVYHPHLHCLIPGVGITSQGEVVLSRKTFLIPVKALSAKFRGRFLELARKAVPEVDFSQGGNLKKWVVFSKAVETQNVQRVLEYLGRYLHRMALSNASILKIEKDKITFRYKKSTDTHGKSKWGVMQLDPMEFLRRFLQHVLPKGMAKVRYYGFMASGGKKHLAQVQSHLRLIAYLKENEPPVSTQKEETHSLPPCPNCGRVRWKLPWDQPIAEQKRSTNPQRREVTPCVFEIGDLRIGQPP